MSHDKFTRSVVFRCDASTSIGGGHIMRCLTLAGQLAKEGAKITFAVRDGSMETVPLLAQCGYAVVLLEGPEQNEAEEVKSCFGRCDWLVVDHYGRDQGFEKAARSFAKNIMVIDDLANRSHDCDLLLDQTFGRDEKDYRLLVPENASILTGTEYALLRPEFSALRPQALARRKDTKEVRHILVSLGASDPHGMTAKVLQAIFKTGLDVVVDVVIGTADPVALGLDIIVRTMPQQVNFHGFDVDMAQLMVQADLAVGAGGSTSWERCCLGLPTIMVVTADNQEKIARELEKVGAVHLFGDIKLLAVEDVQKEVLGFVRDKARLEKMSLSAAHICTGSGAARIALILLSSKTGRDGPVGLRPAIREDSDWLFLLQRKPGTRQFFRNPTPPTPEQHSNWFTNQLDDISSQLQIIILDGQRAGYIRVDYQDKNEAYEISLAVDPLFQGQGIGKSALGLLHSLMPGAVFVAEIMPQNIASRALFLSAGFREQDDGCFISGTSD